MSREIIHYPFDGSCGRSYNSFARRGTSGFPGVPFSLKRGAKVERAKRVRRSRRKKEVEEMLGCILLYVGMVLISNGLANLEEIKGKSMAVMNLFTGGLSLILNIVALSWGIISDKPADWFYASATGLLFAFTYLYTAINTIFDLDQRLYGWYSLFVAINSVPAGILCFFGYGGNRIYGIIWWAWGVLWLTGFLSNNLGMKIRKFSGWLSVIEGIVTAWIPGLLMLVGRWPA